MDITALMGQILFFQAWNSPKKHNPRLRMTCADGFHLPFRDQRFLITLCHYFLMWVSDPAAVLEEMKRVTRTGGHLVVLAEPELRCP